MTIFFSYFSDDSKKKKLSEKLYRNFFVTICDFVTISDFFYIFLESSETYAESILSDIGAKFNFSSNLFVKILLSEIYVNILLNETYMKILLKCNLCENFVKRT